MAHRRMYIINQKYTTNCLDYSCLYYFNSKDQAKVGEFISIANTTIVSFIDEFSTNFPDMQNDEGQFVMAILGTVTNISSTPIGRQYLISHLHGKDLVAQLVKAMPVIPKPSGDSMKK